MFYFHLECHVAFKYDVVILLNDVPLPHTNMLKNVDEKFRENIWFVNDIAKKYAAALFVIY